MKRFLLLAAVVAMAASCGPKSNAYVVYGTVSDSLAALPGAVIHITDSNSREVTDTVAIVGGKFKFEGEASDQVIKSVFVFNGAPVKELAATFIPEHGKININLDENTATGTKLNDAFQAFKFVKEDYGEVYSSLYKKWRDGEITEAEADAALEEAQGNLMDLAISTAKENNDNILGLAALKEIVYELELEQMNDILDGAGDLLTQDDQIKKMRNLKIAEQETSEGCMFKDFEGVSPDGKPVRFSDYVGKGKYVLVDFWASWCGPCKGEIPNIKEMYEKYGKKGLTVLGVAVWDRDNSGSRQTMKEYGMKWPQIFVGTDTTPTDLYGIAGIPRIMLFGPDGTIVKQNVRGDNIKKAISEVLDK